MVKFYTKRFKSFGGNLRQIKAWLLVIFSSVIISLVQGQANDILISVSIRPPVTSKLYDYTKASKVFVQVTNISKEAKEIYLHGMVSNGRDIKIFSDPNYKPDASIVIPAGTSIRLNEENYNRAFDVDHLVYFGISKSQVLEGNFPEGSWTFCFQAFDYYTNKPISESYPSGCSNEIIINEQQPPSIVQPVHETTIPVEVPTIPFVWTMSVVSPDIQYTLKICELVPGTQNVNEAIQKGRLPVVREETTKASTFMLNSPGSALVPGKTYVVAVRASDPSGNISFSLDGWSQAVQFMYGVKEIVGKPPVEPFLIELISPKDSIETLRPIFEWRPKMEFNNKVTYEVKIFEVGQGQLPEQTLEGKNAFLIIPDLKETSVEYPVNSPALDSNKMYVWTVEAIGDDGKITGKGPKGGNSFKLIGQIMIPCFCAYPYPGPQTSFYKCQHDPLFSIPAPSLALTSGCTPPITYGWYDGVTWNDQPSPQPQAIDPSILSCGIHTYKYAVKAAGQIVCSMDYKIYIYPDYMTIRNTAPAGAMTDNLPGSPILDFCDGDFGELAIPSCSSFPVSWGYLDNGSSGPFQTWCPPGSWCNDNPIATNQLHTNGMCPNIDQNGDSYLSRKYVAMMTAPPGYGSWPCPQVQTITTRIYCKPQCGTFTATSSTHPLTQVNSNTWKICSGPTPNSNAQYPIQIQVNVSGYIGHITGWDQGTGTNVYNATINAPGSTNPYPMTYKVRIKNGACGEIECPVNFIVYDPYTPEIENHKEWVCPNKEDDNLCITNTAGIPAGGTWQWQYQINCVGSWYSTFNFGPGNGICQNTNLIGDANPYYRPPLVNPPVSNSLCWRVKFTPPPGSPCNWLTFSPAPTPFHGLIKLIEKPGIPTISVSPAPPKCCGTLFTFTAAPPTGPGSGTPGWSWMWYKDNAPVTGIIADMAGRTFSTTEPGDYFVEIYNKNLCDKKRSTIIHLTCCTVKVKLDAVCCTDGITPVSITVHSSSDCGNQITGLTCTGPNGFNFSFSNPPPSLVIPVNPPPSYPAPVPPCPSDREWPYTVVVTDQMGCTGTATVIIKTCPPDGK